MINELTLIDTIVVPQGAEYQAVCRGLNKANMNVRVVSIPIGMNDIEEIINNSIRSSSSIAIAGLCGSLSKQYSVGDVVLYQDCWNLKGDRVYSDRELNFKIQQKLGIDLVSGLSCDRIIHRATEKLNLSKTYPVKVVDMAITFLQQPIAAIRLIIVILNRKHMNI